MEAAFDEFDGRQRLAIGCQAHELISDGELGELRTVQATCWFYKPDDYFEAAPWRTRVGAGPISVNLVHNIDSLRHLCGEIVHVQAQSVPSAHSA